METHFQLYKTQLEGEENVPNAYHIVVLLLFTKYSSLVVSLPAKLLPAVIDVFYFILFIYYLLILIIILINIFIIIIIFLIIIIITIIITIIIIIKIKEEEE